MLRSILGKSSVDSSELDNCTAALPLAEEAVGSEHPLSVVDAAKLVTSPLLLDTVVRFKSSVGGGGHC